MSKIYFYTSYDEIDLENILLSNLYKYYFEDYCFNKTEEANFVLGISNLPYVNNDNITLFTALNTRKHIPYNELKKVKKIILSSQKEYILLQGEIRTNTEILLPIINTNLIDEIKKEIIKNNKPGILIFNGEELGSILKYFLILNLPKKYNISVIGLENDILIPGINQININPNDKLIKKRYQYLKAIAEHDIIIFTNRYLKYNLTAVESLYMNKTIITLENNYFYENYKDLINEKIFILESFHSIDKYLNRINEDKVEDYIKQKNEQNIQLWGGILDDISIKND